MNKSNFKNKKNTPVKTKTDWNEVGDWYDALVQDQGSEYHQQVIFPSLLPLIAKKESDFKDLKIVDLGCGQGVLTRKLANLGADCTGIDLAPSLIAIAKRRGSDSSPIKYIKADITDLLSNNSNLKFDLSAESFDYATLVLTIQNLEAIRSVFKASYKLLKKSGSLIIVMMHPAFRIPKHADWFFDEKLSRQGRIIYQYLSANKIEITTHPGTIDSPLTYHFHRPLKYYINALASEGFIISFIDELITHKKEQKSAKSEALEAAKKEIPMFMIIKASKK
jgi:2-polyprenyl-3-methyl-5-hydroxy-6-metoxy-1,4-benzoquinol methylase